MSTPTAHYIIFQLICLSSYLLSTHWTNVSQHVLPKPVYTVCFTLFILPTPNHLCFSLSSFLLITYNFRFFLYQTQSTAELYVLHLFFLLCFLFFDENVLMVDFFYFVSELIVRQVVFLYYFDDVVFLDPL